MKRAVMVVAVIGMVFYVFRGSPNHVALAASDLSQPGSHVEQEDSRVLEAKYSIPKTNDEAVAMAERIEKSFSAISAAASLTAKGKASIDLRDFDEAYDAYTQLFAIVNLNGINSSLIREVNAGRSYALLRRSQDLLNRAVRTRIITPEALESIRDDMNLVIQLGVGHAYVARATLLLGEVEVLCDRPRNGLMLVEKYLDDKCVNPDAVKQRPLELMQMNVFVAQAARASGDYARASQACDRVEAVYDQLSRKQQDKHNIIETKVAALFERFMAMFQADADPADRNAVGQEVISSLPESQYATIVKMYMRSPSSMPSP